MMGSWRIRAYRLSYPVLLVLWTGLLAGPARGAERRELHLEGYLKNLWQYSASALEPRPYFLNTTRARLTSDASYSLLRLHLDYDHEVLAGSYFRTREYRAFGLAEPDSWLTMEQTISTGDTYLWRHRLYRGWLGVEGERGALRFGRQRISWGTGKLWNPTDLLNPFQPTSVERDERRGVDAAYARLPLGELSQAELAWAPRDRFAQHALLARARSHAGAFDLSVMGGKTDRSTGSWVAGGDFAGDLLGGAVHGEWSYTDPKVRTGYWRGLIGYEYSFSSDAGWGLKDLALLGEYFHNGGGEADRRRYNPGLLLGGRETLLGRDYLGGTLTKDLHPLLKLELFALANLRDGSALFAPSLQWSALEDLYLTAGFQRFGGAKSAEFGRLPNLGYLQAQFFF